MNSADTTVLAARLGDALVGWVGSMVVASAAILAAALIADRLLERRVSASVRLLLYAAVLARLALPAGWHSPLGLLGRSAPPPVMVAGGELTLVTLGPAEPVAPSLGLAGWAAIAYAAVALALLGRWIGVRVALRRRLRATRPLPLAAGGVPVLRHESLGPLVAGLWRPRIVLPAALADGNDTEAVGWVLRHEAAHVQRRDLLVGTLVQLACIAAWPVLPVWIAARRIRSLMEVACDERAVKDADSAQRRRYGEVLLAVAGIASPRRPLAPVLSFGTPLRGRLRALAARRRWPVALQALAVATVGALAIACASDPEVDTDGRADGPLDAMGDAEDAQIQASLQAGATGSPSSSRTGSIPVAGSLSRPGQAPAWGGVTSGAGVVAAAPGRGAAASALIDPFGPSRSSQAAAVRGSADGQYVPTISIWRDGAIWLSTRRGGSTRVGEVESLESAIRGALGHTGGHTVLVRAPDAPRAVLDRVLAALPRAGVTDYALSTVPDRIRTIPAKGTKPARYVRSPSDVEVMISGRHDVFLWGEKVTLETLEQKLGRYVSRLREHGIEIPTLVLRGDADASLGLAVDIEAAARRAGLQNAAVLTEHGAVGTAPAPATTSPLAKRTDPVVTVTREGHLYLGRKALAPEALEAELRDQLATHGSDTVLVRTDRRVLHLQPELMAIAKRAGARNVAILSEPPAAPASPASERKSGLVPGQATLRGRLDKEIIRRTIAGHIDEAKACYERVLVHKPSLAGRITVQFTIAASGEVVDSALTNSTMNDAVVEDCMVRAVRGWTFQKPEGGGIVIVTYPFSFTPQAEGKLDPGIVSRVMKLHTPAMKDCYEQHVRQSRPTGGKLIARFTVDATGTPRDVSVIDHEIGSAPLRSCIVGVVERARFRPPEGGPVTVEFPVILQGEP